MRRRVRLLLTLPVVRQTIHSMQAVCYLQLMRRTIHLTPRAVTMPQGVRLAGRDRLFLQMQVVSVSSLLRRKGRLSVLAVKRVSSRIGHLIVQIVWLLSCRRGRLIVRVVLLSLECCRWDLC